MSEPFRLYTSGILTGKWSGSWCAFEFCVFDADAELSFPITRLLNWARSIPTGFAHAPSPVRKM
jgi:hypothetical protein